MADCVVRGLPRLLAALTLSAVACGVEPADRLDRSVVCGAGTFIVDGQCVAVDALTCGPGTLLEGDVCVAQSTALCGDGTRELAGRCVPDDGVCGSGTRMEDGLCVPTTSGVTCGQGTQEVDGTCFPVDAPLPCGPGTEEVDGECVTTSTLDCGPGTEEVDGECVSTSTLDCGPGTEEVDGECVPTSTLDCGPGTEEVDGECVPTSTLSCGPGTERVDDECVPTDSGITCGPGTELVDGECRAADGGVVCGDGTIEVDGSCVLDPEGLCGPGTSWRDETCVVDIVPVDGFVLVPPGTFVMGSPPDDPGRVAGDTEVEHVVTISRPFWFQAREVTQGDWLDVFGNRPSLFSECGVDCPVERVNWYEAVQYANRLSAREGLTACYGATGCTGTIGAGTTYTCTNVTWDASCTGYRLPTEAEFEYAYRAGTTTTYYSGPADPEDVNVGRIGWYSANSGGTTHPGGQKEPNAWGLYDIAGNVYEWGWDWFGDDYYAHSPSADPEGPASGTVRVHRGGRWDGSTVGLRAAYRGHAAPHLRYPHVGFRLARSIR